MERRTSPVELLWDLVFVFAVTQVTALLAHDLTWAGFGRSMLVLALVWWAWSAFVWAANAQDTASPVLRMALLLAMVLIFITGLAIPGAFGVSYARLGAVGALAVLFVAGGGLAAWALAGLVTVVLVALCAYETTGERRAAPAFSP